MSRWKLALSFGISAVIGLVLLGLAASALEVDALVAFWEQADRGQVALALLGYGGLFGVVHLLRMWRWRYLVQPLGEASTGAVLRAGAIGFAAILLLPLRLGELVRPYVLSRETPISMSAATGTVVVERVVDGLFITGLLFITLMTYDGAANTAWAVGLGWAALGIFSGALGVCALASWRRAWTLGMVRGVAGRVSPALGERLAGMLEAFLAGIGALWSGRALLPFLGLTAAYWGLNGASIALLGSWGFGLGLSPWAGMTVLALLVVGLMIPAGPGLAGNYEWFALRGLGLFVGAEALGGAGVACVAGMHVMQFLVQVLPGALLMWLPAGGRPGYRLLALSEGATRAVDAPDPPL